MAEGIKISWHNKEKTIIFQHFLPIWTLSDYWVSVDETHTLIMSVEHPVYFISNIETKKLPDGFITALRKASGMIKPNERTHYIIGGGLMVRGLIRIGEVFNARNKSRFKTCGSIAEAEMLIKQEMEKDAAENASKV